MRHLTVFVAQGKGQRALELAREHGGSNLLCFSGRNEAHPLDALFVTVPNEKLDPLLGALQSIDDLRVTFAPQGMVALQPPQEGAPEQVKDVSPRSPLEIFLGGIQSIGSWKGFLGYAAAGGAVVWTGLHANTIYLLTAAMLISPFAGPAMNLALGTARGDLTLIWRSLVRYAASLALSICVAFLLSLALQQDTATELMVQTSIVSSVAVLLPLTAGAAGALNLCQSERNSLVTAAGPGILVAASLAPPAGTVGMALAIGEWDMVKSGLFLLMTQLVGINLSGAAVFALFGLSPQGVRYSRGRGSVRWIAVAGTVVALAAVLTWQFWKQPELQRGTRTQRIASEVRKLVRQSGLVDLIEANVRFTRADIRGQNSVLVILYTQRRPGQSLSDEQIKKRLTERVQQRLQEGGFQVTPLVDVSVLEPPSDPG